MKSFINGKSFTVNWIKEKHKELKGDPILIEKNIHAFALLGYLVQAKLDFVFKGGTSLLLHLEKIRDGQRIYGYIF